MTAEVGERFESDTAEHVLDSAEDERTHLRTRSRSAAYTFSDQYDGRHLAANLGRSWLFGRFKTEGSP